MRTTKDKLEASGLRGVLILVGKMRSEKDRLETMRLLAEIAYAQSGDEWWLERQRWCERQLKEVKDTCP